MPSAGSKAFTIMSVDEDNDHEPDYSMIYHHNNRQAVCPIRFDFLNIPGTAQAQKPNGTNTVQNFTIFLMKGWFETTNTCIVYSNQVEYENTQDNKAKAENSPLILLGGDFEQFVSTRASEVTGKTIYIHVGSNVYIKNFGVGTHSDGNKATPHIPVSVTGGEYEGFYLSGTYNPNAAANANDHAECYISSGHFVEAAGACQEKIDGNVRWQIYNADIDAFYGGGINAAKPITGTITTDIYNSHVGIYCGGPKFGNMTSTKDVTTNATGCVFEKYFGAGYGGLSYSRQKYYDESGYNFDTHSFPYTGERGKYYDGESTYANTSHQDYGKKGPGVATDFDYEFFVWSTGVTGARMYVKFASFSLAQCDDVYSTLTNCTINQNFYGGGSFGSVSGTATSVLNGCTVHGNVFGGGYSATREKVAVRDAGFTKNPKYNSASGMFEKGVFSGTTDYEWKHVNEMPANGTTGIEDSDGKHYIYTDVDLDQLGKVGNTVLTIQGSTVVEGKIFEYDDNGQVVKDGEGNYTVAETSGGVFGGGDMSAVNHDTQVTIEATGTNGVLNVFGGGNTADVVENTMVTITGGTIGNTTDASDTNGNVYGGGKGATTVVGGEVIVNLGTRTDTEAPYTYTGTGLVKHNVYGGSALGSVNTTPNASSEYDKTTTVNIYKGTVNGSVFGGGLGHDDEDDTKDIVAQNFGNTTVTIENSTNANANVKTAVYGGANENGVMKANTTVTITGGTVGTVPTGSDPITNVVFGGGYGEPTLVEGDVEVNIGSEGQASGGAAVNGHVYGGGALGCVNTSKPASDLVFNDTKHTHVNLFKGLIKGNVYGGGLGQQASLEPVKPAIAAYVGGDVQVILDGAQLNCTFTGTGDNRMPLSGQIFGANNLNGTPKGHVKVWVKRTVGTDKSSEAALAKTRDQRGGLEPYSYDVAAVYGGGNQADYIPVDPTPETPLNDTEDYAEVIIEGCELTSIEYVYGGGNAAAVPATDVTILGSYIIDYVFGGGNGKSTATFTNPGANVGSYNNGATSYGSGKAVTKLVGCHAHYVFGGSNTKGNVRKGTSILMPDKKAYEDEGYNCCPERDVREIYGAGNEAEQDGNVTLILGCVSNMKNVYGGARNANVKGGIDLVVTSGSFEGVFGGNDQSGTIQGPITVTIEETGCDPLEIDNLYLGGNQAAYSIYGYKNTGTEDAPVLVARTKAEFDELTAEQKAAEGLPYADPVLNVVSCTRIGKTSGEDLGGAFGGGLGNGAVMYGSPTVNVNMIPGKYAKDIDRDGTPGADDNANALGTITNVYGGGKEANVEGNTAVNINTVEKIAHRTNMGAEIPVGDRVQKDVLPAIITNNVFGAGKGRADDVTSALVTGNTTITMGGGSVAKSVYGGGELSQVGGNTNIIVRGGEIGDETGTNAGETYGNVYGGGKGNTTNVRSGLVKGNTNITIQNTVADEDYHTAHPETAVGAVLSSPSIYHNIYGGGAHGSVGTYSYASEADGAAINGYTSGGAATITITGGTIGVNGHDNGMVFGASRGDVGAPESIYDNVAWVYSTNVVIGTDGQGTNVTSPHIKGSVYGGGENGHVYQNASLTIHSGMVGIAEGSPITDNNGTPEDSSDDITYTGANYPYRGNVYGAGCGTDKYDNNTKYNPKSGIVNGNATVLIDGGHVVRDVYGAGSMGSVEGNTSVTIAGNAEIGADGSGGGYVFAAARGDAAAPTMATVGSSNLNISGGTIWMDAYGGGQNGIVKGAVTVSMTGGTVKHDVYGGGALANTNTSYASGSAPANTYVTTVTLNGATINGNLYGGGLGDLESLGEGHSDVAANVNGPVTVTVSNGKAANVFGCNNLNGAPKQAVAVTVSGTSAVETGSAISNVYGGGNLAAYTGNPTVTVSGGTINNVYGGGLGSTAIVTGNTSVTISGGTIGNDVYGGGSQADVTGSVNVTVSGGNVYNDVYGGGALANTNTANWDFSTPTSIYLEMANLTFPSYSEKTVTTGTSVTGLYTRSGSSEPYTYTLITNPDEKAEEGTKYYERHPGSSVDGLYTKSGEVYSPAAGEAVKGITYYEKRDLPGTWAGGKNSTDNTTTVKLIGGVIGNAYGGGLGAPDNPVYVCGDVLVSVNDPLEIGDNTGVAFTKRTKNDVTIEGDATLYVVPVTGRVFGCNNIKGTPLGDVHVNVYSTRQLDEGGNVVRHVDANSHVPEEIQAVYGGGNQADYVPASGKGTHVEIDGCDKTTILKVYGGGSSASVPATDVLIKAALDIGFAFGGGNGGEKVYDYANSVWKENTGASVNGLAKIDCRGGKIGQVFGGSDNKGNCRSTSVTQAQVGDCDLVITRLYGAGNEADVTGDVNIIISGCTASNSVIEYVCGGSYNAHITGDVTLTITSGFFKSVYGGNEATGSIGGHITVNIEETDDCKPIIIGSLVGGGNAAPYPGTKRNGDKITDPGKVTVNVKSATRIDNIYGGGFGAEVLGDTEVNINMRKGYWAGKTYEGETYPNALCAIGNVFGGGNAGRVRGNTEVNIGTSTTVQIMKRNGSGKLVDSNNEEIYDESGNFKEGKSIASIVMLDKKVLGANITGNVYGGGNMAEVTGDSKVNIGARLVDDPETEKIEYTTVDFRSVSYDEGESYLGIKIGGSVYGGGNIGSVGDYDHLNTAMPTSITSGGKSIVTIAGDAQIGPASMPADFLSGYANTADVAKFVKERFIGHVFGGCKGDNNISKDANVEYKSWVNKTYVTIGDRAFVKGSVYGGAENGHVLNDTHVYIDGGQIGCGAGQTAPYASASFIDIDGASASDIETAAAAMTECPHWVYGRIDTGTKKEYKSYDPFASSYDSKGGATVGSDGHTYYGNVFGGGSGAFPYAAGKWLWSAGAVYGNTYVTITGGHILTNIYGGNELTNVGQEKSTTTGTATVTFGGTATLGVPRTLTQIAAHPVTCYLFGAGKGDQRVLFNKSTNVNRTEVNITGGRIYGSIFGGGEDGHVMGDVDMNISGTPWIGTWGTSYVDGNVFGGGRGFGGDAYTAGNVGGCIDISITGGTMLGSIYGGGRLGTVGYGLYSVNESGYGIMRPDNEFDDGTSEGASTFFPHGRGHVNIDISGTTVIGNTHEFKYIAEGTTIDETYRTNNHIPQTEFDGVRLMHTKGGNVFGGGMGRRLKLDGTPISYENDHVDWHKLGETKSTKVTIHDANVWIKGNVYGGGEFGSVEGVHKPGESVKSVGTEISISAGTIGTVIGSTISEGTNSGEGTQGDETRYAFGSVYGGGYGTDVDVTLGTPQSDAVKLGAMVMNHTDVSISGGKVRASVYGGGELACVGGNTNVAVRGGSIGVNDVKSDKYVLFGGWRMGNVFGGGKGSTNAVIAGLVKGNATVAVSGGDIYHNVYGGGALGSVGNFDLSTEENKASYGVMYANVPVNWKGETGTATVTITGGTIGINGHDNGMVNGSSRGDISTNKPANGTSDVYDHLAWVKNAVVTIGTAEQSFDAPQPQIKGSVYGGGENGHNSGNAEVYVHSGTIGVADTNDDTWSNRGSIYGAGCGTDTYEKNSDGTAFTDGYDHHNPMGGRVQGNTTVSIDGGHIIRSVYGAGSMGSVDSNATVTISGGRIGTDGEKNNDGITNGDVFGGPKGSLKTDPDDAHAAAHVESTTVTIGYATTPASDDGSTTHLIAGSVYGGGEAGLARGSVTVNMNGGLVKNNLYGGGALANTNTNNWNASANTWADGKITTVDGKRVTTYKTTVNLKGGRIMHDAYGGALGRFASTSPALSAIEPKVYGDILVELNNNNNGETADGNEKGCIVERVFGCNDLEGTPKGHVTVHVYATQHANKAKISEKYDKFPKLTGYTTTDYSGLETLAGTYNVTVTSWTAVLENNNATKEDKEAALKAMQDAVTRAVLAAFASADELNVNVSAYTDILDNVSATADEKDAALEGMREAIADVKYDVQAVYGGGNLAPYVPADALSSDEATKKNARAEVIIDGCGLTSIKEVYGSGNAASTPATQVTVNGPHEIDELFGGGNGKDNYQIGTTYYENPGANVGYYNYTTVYKSGDTGYTDVATNGSGTEDDPYKAIDNADASSKDLRINNYSYGYGLAETDVYGGRIHNVYGGSNKKGNIRDMALSVYDDISTCALEIDKTYGAGKNADIDGEIRVQLSCVDYMAELYGGSTAADVNSDVTLTVTNGTFGKVFGGNDKSGTITGSITVNVQESGCRPIIIGELYGGGKEAPYSIYGYNNDKSARTKAEYEAAVTAAETAYTTAHPGASREELNQELMRLNLFGFPKRDPYVNIISATEIGTIYGGGLGAAATVIGSPHVNVNMERGKVLAKYANNSDNTIKTEYTVGEHTDTHIEGRSDKYTVYSHEAGGDAILEIGTIGDIFGGGDASDIIGNTFVEIGTGTHHNASGELVTISPARNAAFITGSVYGGGKMGHVGDFTKTAGKPTSCAEGTGICTVTISNGDIGPDDMNMWHLDGSGNVPADDDPDNKGHVFGGGQGTNNPANDNDAFVDSTLVIINGTAWVKGSVFGGGENGHVLHNAGVKIGGDCQIGNGHILKTDGSGTIIVNRGVNRRYTAAEWAAGHLFVEDDSDIATPLSTEETELRTAASGLYTNSLPECDSWLYGKEISGNKIVASAHHSPYDKNEGSDGYDAKGGKRVASSGRAFNGSVFGGGSGFFPYSAGNWNPKAGQVEGHTWVEVTGGHIMTSLYGGCEMSSMLGDAHVKMTGGTVGVPRTLDEIADHPVTCYVFGGGKGEARDFLDNNTNVRNAFVTVSGGWVYGSVFGGAEDGHVQGNAKVTISGTVPTSSTTYNQLIAGEATKIGTWGTSYVDGNIFGGGRGFDGQNPYSGNIGGNDTINITGGEMLGSIYGGGRLGSVGYNSSSTMQAGDDHGNIVVNISGSPVIGNTHEYVYWSDSDTPDRSYIPNTPFDASTSFTEKQAEDENGLITETASTNYRRLYHTKGGNVFGGSMGKIEKLNGKLNPIWGKLAHAKSTTVTVNGSPIIRSSVYGGSEMGQVEGDATVIVSGGTVGSEVKKTFAENDITQYTFGCLYGGGYGSDNDLTDLMNALTPAEKSAAEALNPLNPRQYSGQVGGSTTVTMSGGWVKASVFGGGKMATVNGNTTVIVSDGEVGLNKVRKSDGYVMYGGATTGNVYGGGRGSLVYPLLGVVKGNTNVTVSGGNVYHMVYGGGALASVGNFSLSTGTVPDYIPLKNVPYGWAEGTGTATVTITGGTIGISGRDNGLVFGSSRGNLKKPEADANEGGKLVDPYDRVAWVKNSVVNIGKEGSGSVYTTPLIKGSVYGGGENGHNAEDATVNVYSGTIGITNVIPGTETADPWWDFGNEDKNTEYRGNRGNVFGAGSGSDTYTGDDGKEHYNPKSGMVGHNTVVNIYGGHVGRNVYGGGSMAMVGTITNVNDTTSTAKHTSETTSFALSWPYKFEFANNTGKATVNVTGGHIGTLDTDGGDVYGSSRGEAGDRYATAHLAYVKETEVNVNYPAPVSIEPATSVSEYYASLMPTIKTDFTIPCITGSVSGSGENGYVYGDTKVTMKEGLIGHSLYGGGKGKGTYTKTLRKLDDSGDYDAKIYSLIAGKVFGNTYVTMSGGYVGRNVYGGGNMASVGKGSYSGGEDDYSTTGYGENTTGNLWDNVSDDSKAFLSSGKTTVNVISGTIGYIDKDNPANSMKSQLPYGNVIGGSAGESAPNISKTPRYLYSPAFFSGYVNETDVTIGGYRCKEAYSTYHVGDCMTAEKFKETYPSGDSHWEIVGPTISASVYGGSQDGHVRRDTKVTVLGGEIGLPFNSDNQGILGNLRLGDGSLNPQWLHRGNVYGGGSGITKYEYDYNHDGDTDDDNEKDYSSSSGSVTRFTEVNVLGGIVHRNVYGGGSLGSVGAPDLGQGYDLYKKDLSEGNKANWGKQSQCSVKISGQIGTVVSSRSQYGGDVFGACRGTTSLDATQFGTSIWTNVHILNGATIFGNVFGGGDAGIVKKNAEVVIGE